LSPDGFGVCGEAEQIRLCVFEQECPGREAFFELCDGAVVLVVDLVVIGLGADRAHQRRRGWLGLLGEEVSHDVGARPLPRRARHGRPDRVDEAGMRVRRDQLYTVKATRDQAAQEAEPRRSVLAGDDVQAEADAFAFVRS
jgi:hypothetical protein